MYDVLLNLTQLQDVQATWMSVFSLGSVFHAQFDVARIYDESKNGRWC